MILRAEVGKNTRGRIERSGISPGRAPRLRLGLSAGLFTAERTPEILAAQAERQTRLLAAAAGRWRAGTVAAATLRSGGVTP
jgi:hypothetical protein